MPRNEEIVLEIFEALENRDRDALFALWHDDLTLHEAASLPYAEQAVGKHALSTQLDEAPERTWIGTWGPLQPTAADRRMDASVVAARGDKVVVEYTNRAVSPDGERFESNVLAIYVIRDGKLLSARMHHYDTVALTAFLERVTAARRPPTQKAGSARSRRSSRSGSSSASMDAIAPSPTVNAMTA